MQASLENSCILQNEDFSRKSRGIGNSRENGTHEAFQLEKKSTWPKQCTFVGDEIPKIDKKSDPEGPWNVIVMSLGFILNNRKLWEYCRQEINMVTFASDKHSCRAQAQTQSWWGGWITVKGMWTGTPLPLPVKAVAERAGNRKWWEIFRKRDLPKYLGS